MYWSWQGQTRQTGETKMLKITIHTDLDLTPEGKRRVRLIHQPRRGERYASSKGPRVIRWYVGQRIYRTLPLTIENAKLSNEWMEAA